MNHHIGISLSHLRQLLLPAPWKLRHKLLKASHVPASKRQNIMLRIGIQSGKCQLVMIILPQNGIHRQIEQEVPCPSTAPFVIKSNMVILYAVGQLWPQAILLGDQKSTWSTLFHNGIEML